MIATVAPLSATGSPFSLNVNEPSSPLSTFVANIFEITSLRVAPRKSDLEVTELLVIWTPWRIDEAGEPVARFGFEEADVGGFEFYPIDDQCRFVPEQQVDDDTFLLQHLNCVLYRTDGLDLIGPIDSLVAGDRRREPPHDERDAAGDDETRNE